MDYDAIKEEVLAACIPEEEWEQQRMKDIRALPEPLRKFAEMLWLREVRQDRAVRVGLDASRLSAGCVCLDECSSEERQQLFQALHPRMASYLGRMWDDLPLRPYMTDYCEKRFRRPHNLEATYAARLYAFLSVLAKLEGLDQSIMWLADHRLCLGYGSLDLLFTAAINLGDAEGEALYSHLLACAGDEAEEGDLSCSVICTLQMVNRSAGWQLLENTLLAAQRQEGLRQSLLEEIDSAHPEAFKRMLKLLVDEKLLRFSSVVQAVNEWLGYKWDSISTGVVSNVLEQLCLFMNDAGARNDALESDDAETVYLAMWATAMEDVDALLPVFDRLLNSRHVEHRFVAAYLIVQCGEEFKGRFAAHLLQDEDPRIVKVCLDSLNYYREEELPDNLFDPMVKLCRQWPDKKTTLAEIVWPWCEYSYARRDAADKLALVVADDKRMDLVPYIPLMEPMMRSRMVDMLAAEKEWGKGVREFLLSMVGNASPDVRKAAFRALQGKGLNREEASLLEALLSRKAADMRRGVLALLQELDNEEVIQCVDRLLESGKAPCRLAGVELMRTLVETERCQAACVSRAEEYAKRPKLSNDESKHLDVINQAGIPQPSRDDAFGMMDPNGRTPVVQPRRIDGVRTGSPAACALLGSLDALVELHAEEPIAVIYRGTGEERDELLGNVGWWLFPSVELSLDRATNLKRLPLAEVWIHWFLSRSAEQRDEDELELFRAWTLVVNRLARRYDSDDAEWASVVIKDHIGFVERVDVAYNCVCKCVLEWLIYLHPQGCELPDLMLNALEDALARVPRKEIEDPKGVKRCYGWRHEIKSNWESISSMRASGIVWSLEHEKRYYQLLRFMDEPGPVCLRDRPSLELTARGVELGYANGNDLMDVLMGPDADGSNITSVTYRGLSENLKPYAFLSDLGNQCRNRILDIELGRGDMNTPATELARCIRYIPGMQLMVRILEAMGKDAFRRGDLSSSFTRADIFSHLIRVAMPLADDAPEKFAELVKQKGFDEQRLVDLALFAPQWARFVEHTLGWKDFAAAVWWIHGHTKDDNWQVEDAVRESWEAQIAEQTPLSAADLLNGTVDVQWFLRVYKSLKAAKWARIDAAAKYASGSAGHKRAQLFAYAMLGKVKKTDLKKRITEKRNQDAVRAYGLLPLARGARRDNDILDRYKLFQEFLRGSRQFGSQRKDSEKRAVNVGMDNLARTAGYADPQRLAWAMEAREVSDMKDGRLEVVVDDVRVVLEVNEQAKVTTHVWRDDKVLKSIPAKLGKHKEIKALKARATSLRRQASRIRLSLEQAMCRGDVFSGAELHELMAHPLLGAYLRRLVLMGEVGMGYPEAKGRALRGLGGAMVAVGSGDQLRIAHPFDLLETGLWHHWQQDCFEFEVVQPFKQLFRELYVLTAAEKKKQTESERYAGHQVNPSQALALLGARGWVARPEEGVFRTFHELNLIATLSFEEYFFSPGEVEGLTISTVSFLNRETGKAMPLESLPAAVFSEVMRDLDLVVSKAHRGGVDPEATASTVEMRASLLKETFRLLKIDHFEQKGDHIVIRGERATYSLHLGSGIIHTMPGGMLFIVPVHAQHRGRLFIPFADDDPKTAEIISKALMLARDKEIKDPQILEQLTR